MNHNVTDNNVLIIGDSIVRGAGVDDSYGWAHRLRDRTTTAHVTVDGIGGRTVVDIVQQLKTYTLTEFDTIIVAVGINDSVYRSDSATHRVPIDTYETLLRKIATSARTSHTHLIYIGLTRVNESMTTPYREDKHFINQFIEQYDQRLELIAHDVSAQYVTVPPLNNYPSLLSDGLHPSSDGYELLYNQIHEQISY